MYRINELLKLDKKLYHSQDLAVLWGISNKNTLYTTIKRYIKRGILIPIYKGLYSTISTDRLDPLELGAAIIHKYTYVSTETILAKAGIISQMIYSYTFISSVSKKVVYDKYSFNYRKLKDEYLHNTNGINLINGIYTASPERAVADMLYFDPSYHFDTVNTINWENVKQIQKEIGFI